MKTITPESTEQITVEYIRAEIEKIVPKLSGR